MPQRPTIIVFDWDDTLFPTTWFLSNRSMDSEDCRSCDVETRRMLRGIGEIVCKLMTTAQHHGTVILITSASTAWVRLSASYYSDLVKLLFITIPVVSCPDRYDSFVDNSVGKEIAFNHVLDTLRQCALRDAISKKNEKTLDYQPLNIISVGDSESEMVATTRAAMAEDYVKTCKMLERPGVAEIANQVVMLTTKFHTIVNIKKSCNVSFELKRKCHENACHPAT